MDVFKLHGIGGMVGSFLTGIFSQKWVSALDGLGSEYSGAMDGVGVQVGRQLAEICAISSYSFVVSCILLYALKYIPFMHLRVSEEAEMIGLDLDQFFDEQIGDWSMMEQHTYEGVKAAGAQSSSQNSVKVDPTTEGVKEA
jgi:Amt family ammonium transporter